jgi:hypothetical protein
VVGVEKVLALEGEEGVMIEEVTKVMPGSALDGEEEARFLMSIRIRVL